MTLTVQITSKSVRNKKRERGVLKERLCHLTKNKVLFPLPSSVLEIFISTEMQNMEHLLACLGQKTMMLLLPTEQCSLSVAYPFILVLIHKFLTQIYWKLRCNRIYAMKILQHHYPLRLQLSTLSHKNTDSFLRIPLPFLWSHSWWNYQ